MNDTPISAFWWSRCKLHMGLNAVRVVAVFTALQLVAAFTALPFLDEKTGGPFWTLCFFFFVIVAASSVFRGFRSRPRYLWVAVNVFGHVAGFAFKTVVFLQVKDLKLFKTAWLILLALLLLIGEFLLLMIFQTGRNALRKWCKEKCGKEQPTRAKTRVRLKAAIRDVYTDAIAVSFGYLVFAFIKASIRGMGKEQIEKMFELEEPPCFRHEGNSTEQSSHVVHGRRRANEEEEHESWISNDGILLLLFLVCFFLLPVLEYWLHAASSRLNKHANFLMNAVFGRFFNVLSTAIPLCMAFQAHGLITDGLEMVAEDSSVQDSTLLMYLAISALLGFFLSSTFPPLADTKNEKRRRLKGDHEAEHAGTADHHEEESSSCTMLEYRSKMLSPSHKRMWAIWVGLLCEIAVNCLTSQVKAARYITAVVALVLFVIVGYFLGEDYAKEFEHHVDHEYSEMMNERNKDSGMISIDGEKEQSSEGDSSDMYAALVDSL